MDDCIGRLVANAGVDRTAAERAVGITLHILLEDAATNMVDVPIASAARAAAATPSSNSPSTFGTVGGFVEAGNRMTAAGVSCVGRIQAAACESMSFARENAGEGAVGEIVGAIPGLGRLV